MIDETTDYTINFVTHNPDFSIGKQETFVVEYYIDKYDEFIKETEDFDFPEMEGIELIVKLEELGIIKSYEQTRFNQ